MAEHFWHAQKSNRDRDKIHLDHPKREKELVMELTIEISEKDLLAYGLESVQHEINQTLRWMKIRQSFLKISGGLKAFPAQDYQHELEAIRETAWKEYQARP